MAKSSGEGWRPLLRALRSRNYRLFAAGQSLSLIGTWMQQVAMSWLVYRLTGSSLMLGILGFTSQFPSFVIAPVAGVLADRADRRKLLLATQIAAMIQAIVLAVAVTLNVIEVWHLVVMSVFLAVINGFEIPIRQSFVVEMVEHREDLGNAIALNSSMFNAARLVGPAAAGLMVGWLGEGWCFALNAASYLAVILALAAMRLTPAPPSDAPRKHVLRDLVEGFEYAYRFVPIRSILLVVALVSFAGISYAVLTPVFAKEVLGGGAHTYGFLGTAGGFGALAATIYLASRKSVVGLGRVMATGLLLLASGVTVFALSTHLALSLFALSFAGFGMMAVVASSNTILQTILEEDKRGRVMSFFTMAFMGTVPFGSFIAGALAERIGPRDTVLLGAGCLFVGSVFFMRHLKEIRREIRPIYRKLGIIPEEVAEGLETASEETV